jgi:ArsR family transcriptional regulator
METIKADAEHGPSDQSRLNEISAVLKSLAHPSRLFIVETLGKLPHCVCELTAMIGADTSTVSKHLSVLKSAGVVIDEKRGNQVFYSLACPCVLDAVSRLTPLLEQKLRHYTVILDKSRL